MKRKYITIAVIAIIILVVPSIVYLCFLVPQLKDEYNILMASGGIIGGSGFYGASKIPDNIKYSSLFKGAAKAYSLLAVSTLCKDFLPYLIGLVAVIVTSYVVYKILWGVYKNGRERSKNKELADEIARSINESIK